MKLCKICNGKTNSFYDEIFDNVFYLCLNCEFLFKKEDDLITTKEEFQIYENHNNSIDDPGYVAYFKDFLDDALFKYVKEGSEGLDFGSGPEPVLAAILERDYNCKIDIYDLFYSPKKVYVGKKYDFITSTEVIEHLKEPINYFHLFNSLLDKDNFLGIMTLFHQNDIEEFLNWHYRRDMSHISFYTPKTLEVIANITGFKLIYDDGRRYAVFKKVNDN